MENFDFKKYLAEGKLLNEGESNQETQFKTKEGEPLKAGETYTYVGKLAKDPRTVVTDEDQVENIKVSLNNCTSYACYFEVLDPEFINRGFKELTINMLETEPEKISKHIKKL